MDFLWNCWILHGIGRFFVELVDFSWIFRGIGVFCGFFVDGGSGDPATGCNDGTGMVQGWCKDGARMVQSRSDIWGLPPERHIRDKQI